MITLTLLALALAAGIGFAVYCCREGVPSALFGTLAVTVIVGGLLVAGGTMLQQHISGTMAATGAQAEPLVEVDGTYLVSVEKARAGHAVSFYSEVSEGQVRERFATDFTLTFDDEATVTRTEMVTPAGWFWPWEQTVGIRYDFRVPEDGITR